MGNDFMQSIGAAKKRHQNKIGRQTGLVTHCPLPFELSFKIVDEAGQGLKDIPFKILPGGSAAVDLHLADGHTDSDGATPIVSTAEKEAIDFYLTWSKLNV